MEWCLNLRWAGQLGERGVSSNWKIGERDVDIRGLKVVAPACVDWGPFIVDPWTSIWLCIDRMSDVWGPVNRRSLMIVVVGRYPIIPLEVSIYIVYDPPTDSSACDITWKTCTRERWDPNRPYNIVMKYCHTWLWYPDSRLNRIDRILILSRYTFFSESSHVKNFRVKRAWPGAISGWVTNREVFPDVHKWEQSAQKRVGLICGASLWT
jgi:hypothetical protein